MNVNNPFVAQRAKHQCEYCHAPEVAFNIAFEVEHIIPLARKGSDDLQNLALSCRICNLRKSNRIDGFDPVSQQNVKLFHPRVECWSEHFPVQAAFPFQIEGRTPVGRATVECLQLNSPLQLKSRKLWIALGIFAL